uniref:Putative conserved plasma membrane protein n=1 Tax=Tabanus bromius TaxID=304241 RepID=A0A0K8TMH1_TABBR
MFELPKLGSEHSYYDGSRAFEWLANMCGLSVDLVNFLLTQVTALFLASLFRSFLHPSKVTAEVRHTFGLIGGLVFGYFCFGQQAIHIAILPTLCYLVIRTHNPQIVQRSVMIVALLYLSIIHLHRQIYDYGSYSLDITGPLMIITQKVTSLAFSIHDGFTREEKDLTKAQQYHAVRKLPSPLEFFSYVLHFQGLMAGPMVFYKDYIDFIEGYHFLKYPTANTNLDNNSKEIILEPSPTKSVVKKVVGSLICAFIFMKFITVYPIKSLKDDGFIGTSNFLYKFWFMVIATTVIRFKYYHAWLLADAICNNSGLGFNGYEKDGSAKWDLISNINVLPFEFGTNFRDSINNWNIGTNRWLREVVYERVPKKYGTILTFGLSALWHGFYPGYYVTFATGALIVMAARSARRMFRHRFQQTQFTRVLYDILTCLTTRFFMGYATFPFVLLEFKASLRLYLNVYMCLHLVAIVTIFVFPKFIRGESRSKRQCQPISCVNDANIETSSNECDINTKEIINTRQRFVDCKKINPIIVDNTSSRASLAVRVKHDECEMDKVSSKLKEKIEIETRNIEEFIDKTVTGIVELKDDLMRKVDNNDLFMYASDGGVLRKRPGINAEKVETVDAFLKKEIDAINAAVQQANVLPAVLSNGHAK